MAVLSVPTASAKELPAALAQIGFRQPVVRVVSTLFAFSFRYMFIP